MDTDKLLNRITAVVLAALLFCIIYVYPFFFLREVFYVIMATTSAIAILASFIIPVYWYTGRQRHPFWHYGVIIIMGILNVISLLYFLY